MHHVKHNDKFKFHVNHNTHRHTHTTRKEVKVHKNEYTSIERVWSIFTQ